MICSRKVSFVFFTVSLVLSIAYPGPAGNVWAGKFKVPPKDGEFRYAGGAIVCITTDTPDPEKGYLPCLHIGPVSIGQSYAEIQKMLGEPWKTMKHGAATVTRVYPIQTKKEGPLPYWVIQFINGTVEAIQLTGFHADKELAFSSIRPGDRQKRVTDILGAPAFKTAVKEINGVLWSYRPFPISIEIKDKRVYSIWISRSYNR